MKQEEFHTPVMIKEVLEYLDVQPGKKYIDATLGGGAHSAAILSRGSRVLGMDLDPEALEFARRFLLTESNAGGGSKTLKVVQGNFRDIDEIARQNGFTEVAGILFDLGMSSYQIERSGRGFSFLRDEPLDMRMDLSLSVTAADLINGLSKKELDDLFQKFGEEKLSRRFTHAIIRARRVEPIETTSQLVKIILGAYGGEKRSKFGQVPNYSGYRPGRFAARIHPATRVFQALRIAVNGELENLQVALPKALDLLARGGRLVVISFHSLEDRIVKREFLRQASLQRIKILTERLVRPMAQELRANPKARSAKLRAVQKL